MPGEENPQAKLTAAQVHKIRILRPSMTLKALGEMFGVHLSTIHLICSGKKWAGLS